MEIDDQIEFTVALKLSKKHDSGEDEWLWLHYY